MSNLLRVGGAYVPYQTLAALYGNTRGPAGPVGPQGPPGNDGPTGPPGDSVLNIVNAADYGALGNGTKDDTASIQAALDAAKTGLNTWVRLKAGTYKITSTLYVPSQVWLSGESPRSQLGQRVTLKADSSGFDMISLSSGATKSSNVTIDGIIFNGNTVASCGIRMDQNMLIHVQNCNFNSFADGGAAITGGNNLYIYIDDNYFGPYDGKSIHLEHLLSANTGAGYYGINVGTISRNLIYSKRGTIVQGVVDVVSNDIEGMVNGTAALFLGAGDAVGYPSVINNYIELNGGSASPPIGIRFTSGAGVISGNRIYGAYTSTSGSAGISAAAYTAIIEGNHIAGFDTGVVTDFTSSSFNYSVAGNDIRSCNNTVTGFPDYSTISTSGAAGATPSISMSQIPTKGFRFMGGVAEHIVRLAYGTTLDLYRGNIFVLEFPSATTITGVVNATPGQVFRVGSSNANSTLSDAGFNLLSGVDCTLSANQYLTFYVDRTGAVYEVGGTSAAGADFSGLVTRSPDASGRNRITPTSTTTPALQIDTVASQTGNTIEVFDPTGATKLLNIDKNANVVMTRSSFTPAISVYNNSFTTYAFELFSGTPSSSAAVAGILYSGQFQAGASTFAAPSLSYFGDTNTGLHNVSADALSLVVGGKPNLHVTSTGRIALGQEFQLATYGLHQMGGGHRVQALSAPQPTVTVNTTGSTTYNYFIVAEDVAGNRTMVGTVRTVTNSATTPNNTVSWTNVKGTVTYYVLRHTSSTVSGTGNFLAGTVTPTVGGASSTFTDTNASPSSFTVPTRNGTADVWIDGATTFANGQSKIDENGYGFPLSYHFLLAQGTPATVSETAQEYIVERTGVIKKAFIRAKTGPEGAALIVDILLNGTSIWNTTTANRVKVNDGSQTGTQTAFDTTAVTEGDVLSVSIAQIGSGVAGQDVVVQLLCMAKNQ